MPEIATATDNIARIPRASSRRERRVAVQLAGLLRLPDATWGRMSVDNIAPRGLRTRCALETARMLHPAMDDTRAPPPPPFEIELQLPLWTGSVVYRATCLLRYHAVLDAREAVFGLGIVGTEPLYGRMLRSFLQESNLRRLG